MKPPIPTHWFSYDTENRFVQPGDGNDVVDHVQNVLMGPLMENLRAVHPNTPDLEPAFRQIMSGFRQLNQAMDTGAKPDTDDMKSE